MKTSKIAVHIPTAVKAPQQARSQVGRWFPVPPLNGKSTRIGEEDGSDGPEGNDGSDIVTILGWVGMLASPVNQSSAPEIGRWVVKIRLSQTALTLPLSITGGRGRYRAEKQYKG
jgi:hypothetical protein